MSFTHEICAEVIADTLAPDGTRLTTMLVTYNRFIIAEVDTHRRFSRSSASSRAIPFELQLQRARAFPAPFVEYVAEGKGMSGTVPLEGEDLESGLQVLDEIQRYTVARLQRYIDAHPDKSTRLHKSILNRTLEWFGWTTTVISSTEWENFFRQRAHPAAQPEFRELAYRMRDALELSVPRQADYWEWHIPFARDEDLDHPMLTRLKLSAARCARTSYLNHDGLFDLQDDLRLYDETLAKYGHWAPLEHVAVTIPMGHRDHYGNFHAPWHQFRHFIEYGDHDQLNSILAYNDTHSRDPEEES